MQLGGMGNGAHIFGMFSSIYPTKFNFDFVIYVIFIEYASALCYLAIGCATTQIVS